MTIQAEHTETAAQDRIQMPLADDIPRYWVNNNPVITAFFNALSTVIPEGERFFIQSIRKIQGEIDDPELQQQIRQFIVQEGQHHAEHNRLNALIVEQGYPLAKNEKTIQLLLNRTWRHFSDKQQLAATLAMEHYSALLSEQFLRQPALSQQLHPQVRELLIWHSREETEHKAVAFDAYQAVYGSYPVRLWQMLLISLLFVPHVALIQCRYLWHDRQLFNISAWLGAVNYFWGRPGWFRRIVPGWFRYWLPGFHPWHSGKQPDKPENKI